MQTTQPPRLLIIDSERKFLQKVSIFFQKKNIVSDAATSASMAEAMLKGRSYPIVITDFFLPNETVNLLEMVRKNRPESLVIILTSFGVLDSAIAAIREGCFDYLQKPVKIDQLIEVIHRAEEEIEKQKRPWGRIVWDRAAESNNLLSFREKVKEEFYRANRYKTSLSLIIITLDNFEIIKNRLGCEISNFLLKKVVPLIREQVRISDAVYLNGEDKIGIVLPKTGKLGAVEIARKFLRMFSDQEFDVKDQCVNVSMSLSIASYPEDPILTHIQLIKFAEETVDVAKKDGGSQIGFYGLDVFAPSTLLAKVDSENVKLTKLVKSKHGLWKKLKKVYVESLDASVKSLHAKDDYHKIHSVNVSRYAEEIALMLGMDICTVERIKYAGILHDIGKIGVPEEILLKPDRLTGEEFGRIKRHCEIGVKIVRDAYFLQEEIPIIMHHHEWFDGSGYPCGLKGENIPIGARIVGIADTFDSLTQQRCYRKRYDPDEAIEKIKEYSGVQFDPELVNCIEMYVQEKNPLG